MEDWGWIFVFMMVSMDGFFNKLSFFYFGFVLLGEVGGVIFLVRFLFLVRVVRILVCFKESKILGLFLEYVMIRYLI